MGKIDPKPYQARVAADMEQANKIVRGEAPAQATKGVMTNAERRASIAKAFGAKPFGPDEPGELNTGKTEGVFYEHKRGDGRS